MMSLDQPITAGFGLTLAILGHVVGWPFPRGGAQKIVDAMAAYLRSLGGKIITGVEVQSLEDLRGKKVNFGPAGTGASLTGTIVFQRLGINVEQVLIDQPTALQKLQSGQVDAIARVIPKPIDFFGQRVVIPTANNGDFVANAVEMLAGGNDLVGLRSRGTSARPFDVVSEIERDAQERYSAEERALQQKLKDTQAKLAELTGKDRGNAPATLSPDQAKAIEEFRTDMLQTRRQLREVQAALRSDIGRLKAGLEFLDIALIPIIVAAAAVILGIVRLGRRGRRMAEV